MKKTANTSINRDYITRMCHDYTLLSNEEIETIVEFSKMLPYFSRATDFDSYIDIKIHNEEKALIIAESFTKNSPYANVTFLGYEVLRSNEPAIFRSLELGEDTHDMIGISYGKDGSEILAKQTVIPIFHEEKAVAVLLLEKQLSAQPIETVREKKQTYEDAELLETMLSILGFCSADESLQIREGVLAFDEDGYLVYYNSFADAIYKGLGYRSIDSLHYDSLNFSRMHFEDLMYSRMNMASDGEQEILSNEEKVSIGNKSFKIRVVSTKYQPIKILVFIDDITEIIKYENEINNYLVTYREIHHRIKNNLQTVASLLRLQGRVCEDPEARIILSESINRILSIAVTHDLLSKKNGNQASILEVFESLTKGIIRPNEPSVDIVVGGDDFYLDSEKSAVVALVVNELLQNSMKYAFQGKSNGKVELNSLSNGEIRVIDVIDNGVGYNPDSVKKDSLGLMIVRTYVEEKLSGRLVIKSGCSGTKTSFAFKP